MKPPELDAMEMVTVEEMARILADLAMVLHPGDLAAQEALIAAAGVALPARTARRSSTGCWSCGRPSRR